MIAKTTLVLGAGASLAYGYPLGAGLREKILTIEDRSAGQIVSAYSKHQKELRTFVEAFRNSQMVSIDAFLARRAEFSDIGKLAIASILLAEESDAKLFADEPEDHWYRYLWQRISSNSWDELSFDGLSIVTFNYDCSLERYLTVVMQNTYGRSLEEVTAKLKTLRIVHVYGSLGAALPDDARYIEYAKGITPARVRAAANMISVVPEGRNDSPNVLQAREFLREADSIAFLGFGFDETNLERLDTGNTCTASVKRPQAIQIRQFAATSIGMTPAEVRKAAKSLGGQNRVDPSAFHNVNCTGLLRQTLIIG